MLHLYQDTPIGGGDALYAMTDVNINNPEDGQMLVYDASTQRWRNVTQKSLNDLAEVTDLTNIIATGTTNATGLTIPKGTFFYLNDDLCQAKVDIASGATFTLNTNYEVVTAGGLNSLNSALATKADASALPDLKVYQLIANMSAHQGNGNFRVLNMPSNVVPVCIAPWNATDCNWALFYSSTAHAWFAHASKFTDGSAETSATITTMYIYYVKYTT